uniref:Uncharacterized protein n=1 Tax=Gopherus agassizii TaxID=38772 RepID=A0A452GHS0_9SAUR
MFPLIPNLFMRIPLQCIFFVCPSKLGTVGHACHPSYLGVETVTHRKQDALSTFLLKERAKARDVTWSQEMIQEAVLKLNPARIFQM